MAAIWPDVIVSEDSLTQCIRDLRKAIGDEEQKWIRTVSRRGYVLVEAEHTADRSVAASAPAEAEPVVAVLPFAVAGDIDPVLIDGIIEEITNGLARFKTVTVIARASAFSFPVASRPLPRIIGERLGADHLVDGTFRKTFAGFRISVTLTHAPSGRQLWGEQFDCTERDLLDIDAVIARRIITRLVANIEDAVLRRCATAPPNSLKALEHLMRGKMYLRGYDADANVNAIASLRQAIEVDPGFGLAQAYLAFAEVIAADYGAAPRAVLEAARDRAKLAITLSPEDSRCFRIMGLIQLYLREHGAAESHMRRALELNPYDADALAQMGFVLTMRGRFLEGLDWLNRAIELNPFRPAWYDSDAAYTLYSLGRYQDTIDVLDKIPDSGLFHESRLAAAYAMAGDLARAIDHIRKALRQAGDVDITHYMRQVTEFEHEADIEHLLDGIRLALEARASSA